MKPEIKFLVFNIIVIILFTFIYYYLGPSNFTYTAGGYAPGIIDFFYLGTTIQSTVGLPDIQAATNASKVATTVQQFCCLFSACVVVIWVGNKF